MTNFNFLSKSGGQSMGLSSVTLASTVGSPSVHRRGAMLRLLSVLVLVLTIGVGNVWGVTYNKVTDVSTLASGDEIIIVNESAANALSTTQNTNNRSAQSVTISSSSISDPNANVQVITLGTATKNSTTYWTFSVGTNKWLYAASSNKNYLKTQTTLDDNGKWSISISSGNATITAQGTNTRNLLKYNSSDGLFSCYASGQQAVQIYKKAVASCSNKVALTKGTPSNGTFSLNKSNGSYDNCDENFVVTVSDISAYTGYYCSGVTATGGNSEVTGPDGSGNYTVTYTKGNNITSTITANFAAKTARTVTFMNNGAQYGDVRNLYDGDAVGTLPTAPSSCKVGKVFVGWSETNIGVTPTDVAPSFISASTVVSGGNKVYYAVFATSDTPEDNLFEWEGGTASDLTNPDDVTAYGLGSDYAAGNAPYRVKFDTEGDYINIKLTSQPKDITIGVKMVGGADASNIIIKEATALNEAFTNVETLAISGAQNSIHSLKTSNAFKSTTRVVQIYFNKGNGSNVGVGPIVITPATAYSGYITDCCTELAQINGSVSWSNGEATVSFADLADVTGWGLKYKKSSEENWSTYAGGFAAENGIRSNSTAISGLEAGSQYDFKVTGTYNGSSYCTGAFEVPLNPSSSSYVPKITVTSNLTPFSYIVGNTCASQNFTVSGIGLTGNLTVNAPANFEVSLDNSNWANSKTITVSNPPSNLNNTTIYVRLASGLAVADNYGGNISISGGSAVAISNIAITGIVSPDCSEPTIDTNPAGATYNMGATATALAVEATKEGTGPALTYQWYSNTANNNTSGSIIEGATNSTYTPSTETAGTKYYYCVVSSGACSATSGIAAVTVNTPIITIGGNKTSVAFGSKAIGSTNTETIIISGSNLANAENIGLAIEGTGASAYALSVNGNPVSELEASNGSVAETTVTITYTAAAGLSEATLTISSTGAESKEIALSGTGKYQATFIAGNNSESIFVDGEGKLVLPASNPSSCNGTYSTFIGWYSTAAGTNGAPTTNIASCGTKAVNTHVLESNETYYAVWGNGSLVADDVKQVELDFTSNTEWTFPESTDDAADNTEISYTKGSYTVKIKGDGTNKYYFNSTNNQLLLGKTSGVYLKLPAFDFTVSKIVATAPTGSVSGKITWNVYFGETAVSTEATGCSEGATFVINENYREIGTIYQVQLTNGYNLQFKKLEIYSPGAGATGFISSCCNTWDADPTVSYNVPNDWQVGDDAVAISVSGTTHGTASYESNNSSIISVDENGAITPEAVGTATITVTWSGDGYCEKAVTTAPIVVHGFVDVTFKKNGGTGTDDQTQSVEVGESTALTSLATLGYSAPDCKEFGGWATEQNGEAEYDDADPITATEATTLWAVWNTKTLSVAQGTGTAVGCEGGAFTFASSVTCGGNVTITSSPDDTHKSPFTITVLPADAYEEIDGNVIKNVSKPITSISVSYTEKTSYAITWKVNNAPYAPHQQEEDGKVNGDALVYEGNTIATLPSAPANNTLGCANKFMGWSKKNYNTVPKEASDYDDLFNDAAGAPEIGEATTFYAVFAQNGGQVETNNYAKITSTDDLADGMKFVLVAVGTESDKNGTYPFSVMMNNTVNSSNVIEKNDVTVSENSVTLTNSDAGCVYTLEKNGDVYKIKDNDDKYIYRPTTANKIGLTATASEAREFAISFEEGNASIVIENGNTTDSLISYNNNKGSSERFSIYKTQQQPVMIFKVQTEQGYSDYVTECPAVVAPTFDIAAGTYNVAQTVKISNYNSDYMYFYTTDNSAPAADANLDPTGTSAVYDNATGIAINGSCTLKAVAYNEDVVASDINSAAYVLQVVTPTISGSTSFVNSATVTIEATGADHIYYTTDGSDPDNTKSEYSASFPVDATTTIKAIAVKANWTSSEVAEQVFTKVTPMTVAQANAAVAALSPNGTIANQYVKGLISQIDKFNEDNTITYYISDNGTTASQLQVYHGSAGVANNGKAFTAKENLQLGEEVIVSGILKKFEKSTNNYVYEFDKPNSIVAYKTHSPIAWSANAYTAELGGSENEFPTLSGTTDLTISYSSSDETVATISADGTTYDLKKTGETTITATSAATDDFVATTKSYTLTVSPTVIRVDLDINCNGATSGCPETTHLVKQTSLPNPLPEVTKAGKNFGGWYTDNTFETPAVAGAALTENTTIYAQWLEPYTVAQALTMINNLGTSSQNTTSTEYYYVAGVVTNAAVEVSNNVATYKIKDAGVNNELKVYKGKGLNNANVTEASQIQEGDQVVLYGQLQNFYGTAEVAQGNYIYSRVRPTFDVESVSLPSTANVRAGKTVTLTAEITPSNATDKAVTWSSDAEGVATVDENGEVTGVAEGTAHITVTTHDGGFQATCTVTVAGALPTFTENDHEWIKISNASKLVAGRFYVIAYEAANHTMTKTIDSYASVVSSKSEDGVIASSDLGTNTAIFELGGTSAAWTLTEVSEDKMLGGNASKDLNWTSNQTWTIAFDENNDASIENVTSSCGVLCYNKSASPRRFKTYDNASATCPLPQLYMWAELSHSVTFDANGGVAESVPDVERTDEGKIIIPATEPTHSDISKAFGGWYKSDAPATLYNAGDEFETNVDVTLYAKWNSVPTYTVSYSANGGVGSAPAEPVAVKANTTITVVENTGYTNPGKMFDGWLVTYNNGTEQTIDIDENSQFSMPAYNVVIKATWTEESKQKWALVTDVDDLKAGAKYVISAAGYDYAMAAQKSNNRDATSIVKRNDGAQMMGASSMQVITLEGSAGVWEFNTGAGYLYAASNSGNHLKTQATNDVNGKWAITFEAGVTSIVASGSSNRNVMQFNNSSKLFACYSSASQSAVALYKEIPVTVIDDNNKDQDDVPDGGDMTIKQDKTWTVTSDKEVGDLYMEEGAIIANNAKVEANDLYFKAKAGKSNQIFDLSKITVESNMYYDFQLCDGDVDADYWYSISVPFDVDLNSGVFLADGTPMVNRSDFEVWEYDPQKRADTQYNGWKRTSDNMMHAGKAYLIGFNPGQPNIIRLKAAAGWKTNLFSGTSMSVVSTGGSGTHDNWNGLANPTGRYIDVNVDAQAFNNNTHGWDSYALDAARFNFVVGTAFFVQSASAITIGNTDHGNYRAPKRECANESKCAYAVRITRNEATSFDNQIIVRASEDATSEYEQGHDMLTMNDATSKKAALLWTKNYGGKRLAIEEAPFVGDKASYELGIYAPANGTYFISVAEAKDNADLYLTYEGSIIWNLSAGAYELELGKGATNEYGLMMVRKAPQVTTGVESVQGDKTQCTKVILNDHVYILRDAQLYDVTGKAVK